METIVVKTVEGPNDRGWFNVELEDGRVSTTKDKKVAELAFKHRGVAVQGDITEKPAKDPKFPNNIYLNKLEVAGDPALIETVPVGAPAVPIEIPKSRDEQKQKDISAQWAVGRAVETFLSGGPLVDLPLTQAQLDQIEATASEFAAIRDRLAGK